MDDMILNLLIGFAAPLTMVLLICKGDTRRLLMFLLFGMAVCYGTSWVNYFARIGLGLEKGVSASSTAPMVEELMKAIPILLYAFICKPKRRALLECSAMVGVGFAILENAAYFLGGVSLLSALTRGFGAGMLHCVCTITVGYGISFVHVKRKLFYTGTVGLLSAAIIWHSVYNTLVQSDYPLIGLALPMLTFLPILYHFI